jgi:hypothetical protein
MTRTRRQLLRDLTGAGVGAAGAGLLGRELLVRDDPADAATPSCTLSPEVTEGPFYLDLDKVRRDLPEGKAGLRLDLRIKVVDASSCKPLEDVAVEIWYADAGGTYSGFSQEGTAGKTYLRGVQVTDEHGVAQFRTIYPGWYQGRAIHIHMKVHAGGAHGAHRPAVLPRVGQRSRHAAVALQDAPGDSGAQRRGQHLPAGRVGGAGAAAPAQGEHDPQGADRDDHRGDRSVLGRRSRPTPDVGRLLGATGRRCRPEASCPLRCSLGRRSTTLGRA